jgi:hypothetical protein
MYPQRELSQLAVHKAGLRRDIAFRRAQCVVAAGQVARPLEWLDRAVGFWRRLSPFTKLAAVPLGFLAKRALFPKGKILGAVVRWAPMIFGVVRSVRSAARTRVAVAQGQGPRD